MFQLPEVESLPPLSMKDIQDFEKAFTNCEFADSTISPEVKSETLQEDIFQTASTVDMREPSPPSSSGSSKAASTVPSAPSSPWTDYDMLNELFTFPDADTLTEPLSPMPDFNALLLGPMEQVAEPIDPILLPPRPAFATATASDVSSSPPRPYAPLPVTPRYTSGSRPLSYPGPSGLEASYTIVPTAVQTQPATPTTLRQVTSLSPTPSPTPTITPRPTVKIQTAAPTTPRTPKKPTRSPRAAMKENGEVKFQFVNYSPMDGEKISRGVAPSGGRGRTHERSKSEGSINLKKRPSNMDMGTPTKRRQQ